MTQTDIENIIVQLLKFAGILILIFNAGIGLILLRQIFTMNKALHIKSGTLFFLIILVFIMASCTLLIFSFTI
jgi:hypothetical protein